jgi:hypothetical protein
VTARADNVADLMFVAEKVLNTPSVQISIDEKRSVVAQHYYNIATKAFTHGEFELGNRALHRARELGFQGHKGPLWHRISSGALGLSRRYRFTNYLKQLGVYRLLRQLGWGRLRQRRDSDSGSQRNKVRN